MKRKVTKENYILLKVGKKVDETAQSGLAVKSEHTLRYQ